MCVLTFIPTSAAGFVLTSNRDEASLRAPAIPPKKYMVHGLPFFFPKDPQGGGTWIGSCGDFTLCLLNGAFKKHDHNPPYRQSRGKVILDFYMFLSVEKFLENYTFEGIEPFTLVIIEKNDVLQLNEIRWDGVKKHHEILPADQARIWSSSTLYSDDVIAERSSWFQDFIRTNVLDPESIIGFHHNGGKGDVRNDIKMNRDGHLKTISITQFEINNDIFRIHYNDLIINKSYDFRVFTEC